MSKIILIKPLITEKTEGLTDKHAQYTFVVDRKANKIEIKNAVEKMYKVNVDAVNTSIRMGKVKVKNTKGGLQRGKKPTIKKAVISLKEGEAIDFFGDL